METFYSEKGRQFPDEFFFLSSCFSFQTRADLVLVKFYYDGAFRHFLKTFRKFTGKRLWSKPFLGKFKLFKMDSGKGVFLSVFRTPFYGCLQTLNRSHSFQWKHCLAQKLQSHQRFVKKWKLFLIKCPEILRRKTFLVSLRADFTYVRIFWNVFLSKKIRETEKVSL